MRKTMFSTMLLVVLAITLCMATARPAQAYISTYQWFGQVHPYDAYYAISGLTVFPEGTVATLLVTVYNPSGMRDLNVSAVKVLMDWNVNYTSAECNTTNPAVMRPLTYRTFTITFTVPSTSVASNLFRHGYVIYVEEVNATSGPHMIMLHDSWSGYGFIVYSTVQKEAQQLYDEINLLRDIYGTSPAFSDTTASSLWRDGTAHYEMGVSSYRSGAFGPAKTHYETALGQLNQALSTERTYDSTWQDFEDEYDQDQANVDIMQMQAQLSLYQAQTALYEAQAEAAIMEANASMTVADAELTRADAQMALAQAAMTQAYAWITFGIGFIVFGFAAVIWAYRRGPPSAS
jgi:hypothetical protein